MQVLPPLPGSDVQETQRAARPSVRCWVVLDVNRFTSIVDEVSAFSGPGIAG